MRLFTAAILLALSTAANAQLVIGTNSWWIVFTWAPSGPQPAVGTELDQAYYPVPESVTTEDACKAWKNGTDFLVLRRRWENAAAVVNYTCVQAQPIQPPA